MRKKGSVSAAEMSGARGPKNREAKTLINMLFTNVRTMAPVIPFKSCPPRRLMAKPAQIGLGHCVGMALSVLDVEAQLLYTSLVAVVF